MSKSAINSMLYRPIKKTSSLCGLLPESNCKAKYLGNGDTYLSMDLIKKSIEEYSCQTKKLATKLKGQSLKDTVNNIYNFLYDHIQYKADGAEQLLRSPACSCASRDKGIDCKSYTIFAGCLLENLNISYYIRKIRQPGDQKEKFSHVYIVVPKNQSNAKLKEGYYVIDGTKHKNNEAHFIEKFDIYMKHTGLKGISPLQLPHNGLHGIRGFVSPKTQAAFFDFMNFCSSRGVRPEIVKDMSSHGQKCFNNNVDPNFSITPKNITIENIRYPLLFEEGLNGGILAILGGKLFNEAKNLIGDLSLYDSTIGAVLGNGWRLGCWNTSNSPAQTENEVPIDYEFYLTNSGVRESLTTQSFMDFILPMQAYIQHREYGRRNPKLANCTKDGNQVGFSMMNSYFTNAISIAVNVLKDAGGRLEPDGEMVLNNWNIPAPSGYYNGTMFKTPGEVDTLTIQKYKVIAPVPVVFPGNTGGNPGGGTSNTGGGTTNTGGNPTGGNPIGGNTTGGSNTGSGSNTGGNPTGGSGNTGNNYPAEYHTLNDLEKWLYRKYIETGTTLHFKTFAANSPSVKSYSDALYNLLGMTPPPGGSGQSVIVKPKTVSSSSSQKLGANPLLVLAMAGLAFGAFKQYNKKKQLKS